MPPYRRATPALLVAMLASVAGAQQRPEPTGRFLVAGGVDLLTGGPRDGIGALALHAGYERRLGDSRFGLRAEARRWSRTTHFDAPVDGARLPAFQTWTIAGASLLGTYRFGSGAGRVRPYALAGAGYEQLSVRSETEWVPAPGGSGTTKAVLTPPGRVNAVTYTGGFGLDVPLGRISTFVETRATVAPGVQRAIGQSITTPLTVGIRF